MQQPYIPSLYITFWCSKQRKNFVLKFDYWKEWKEFPWWELKAPHWTWLSSRRTPSSPVLSIFKFYISKVQYLLNCIFIVVQSRQSTDYREQTLHRFTAYKTVKRIFNIELYLCKKLDTDIRTDMLVLVWLLEVPPPPLAFQYVNGVWSYLKQSDSWTVFLLSH